MKRFLFTIVLMTALVIYLEPVRNLIGEILKLEAPETKEITSGDWLSKVAEKNYGDASYWRELALVNRAPNPDLIFPDEEIIIPSYDAIRKIREAGSLSSVNGLVEEQQSILAARSEERDAPQRELTSRDSENEFAENSQKSSGARMEDEGDSPDNVALTPEPLPQESDGTNNGDQGLAGEGDSDSLISSTPFITGIVVLAVVLAIGIFMAVRNRNKYEKKTYGDDSGNGHDSDSGNGKNRMGRTYGSEEQKQTDASKKSKYRETEPVN